MSVNRYQISVQDYIDYHKEGYIVVRGLVSEDEVNEIRFHTEELMRGELTIDGVDPPPQGVTSEQMAQHWLRIHMLHRKHQLHEKYMLQPKILDVLEALIGPDILALQTMLFLKPPGREGQGFHQDAYYIPTYPETLIGSWLAVDPADEENGCVMVIPGSHHEPIYPDEHRRGQNHTDESIGDLNVINGASATDENLNGLSKIASKYGDNEIPTRMAPGDVMFFHSHLLHRSHENKTNSRFRRAFVSHYCNARSWVPWNHGADFEGSSANYLHILARGNTHLPYAMPRFGTPCDALRPKETAQGLRPNRMMGDMQTSTVKGVMVSS